MHTAATQCGEVTLPKAVSTALTRYLWAPSMGGVRDPPPAHPVYIGIDFTTPNEKYSSTLFITLFSNDCVEDFHFFLRARNRAIRDPSRPCGRSRDLPAHTRNRLFKALRAPPCL